MLRITEIAVANKPKDIITMGGAKNIPRTMERALIAKQKRDIE